MSNTVYNGITPSEGYRCTRLEVRVQTSKLQDRLISQLIPQSITPVPTGLYLLKFGEVNANYDMHDSNYFLRFGRREDANW